MGIKTPEMVAEEEGINVEELKTQKEEQQQKEIENAVAMSNQFPQEEKESKKKKPEEKSVKFENDLEKELYTQIQNRAKDIKKALDLYKRGQLDNIS